MTEVITAMVERLLCIEFPVTFRDLMPGASIARRGPRRSPQVAGRPRMLRRRGAGQGEGIRRTQRRPEKPVSRRGL